jgi:hydroxymethylglutaryl-CoA reductase
MHRIRLRGQREGSDLEAELFLPALGLGIWGGGLVLQTAPHPISFLGVPDASSLTGEGL